MVQRIRVSAGGRVLERELAVGRGHEPDVVAALRERERLLRGAQVAAPRARAAAELTLELAEREQQLGLARRRRERFDLALARSASRTATSMAPPFSCNARSALTAAAAASARPRRGQPRAVRERGEAEQRLVVGQIGSAEIVQDGGRLRGRAACPRRVERAHPCIDRERRNRRAPRAVGRALRRSL